MTSTRLHHFQLEVSTMRHNRENDPDRDRSSRNERSRELGRGAEDVRNPEVSDLGRAQIEGNLGNERTRSPSDERPGRRRKVRDKRDL
jgi:hypothetical protein